MLIGEGCGSNDAFIEKVTGARQAAAKGDPPVDFRAIAARYGIEFLS
jgi:hypothetical protein